MKRKELFDFVIKYFSENNPEAETELHYNNAYELLVAVILSAQCTDKRVNMITPGLFQAYPSMHHLSTALPEDIFPHIRSVSYPNNKAKHLAGMARMVMDKFKGEVPSDVNDLQQLPGVGRKTANVIASVIYNQPAMAVDTHVFRVSARIGLTKNAKTPLATEKQLMKYVPEQLVHIFHHWLILHGRYICIARTPKCGECGLKPVCNYYKTVISKMVPAVKIRSAQPSAD